MNFLNKALEGTGVGGIEAISTLASGKSIGTAAKSLAKRGFAKKFEGMFMQAADAYASGYSSTNTALMGAAGISAAVTGLVWGSMKVASYLDSLKEEKEQSQKIKIGGELATFAAFILFAIVWATINITRRQTTFSVLAGENMASQYVKFFSIPLLIFFLGLKLTIPSESLEPVQLFAVASVLSGIVLALVRRFYFVYKINVLEKGVFESIASAFDACDAVAGACDHKHAGFLTVFNSMNSVLQSNAKQVLGDVNYGEIAREISQSQKFDTIRAFIT